MLIYNKDDFKNAVKRKLIVYEDDFVVISSLVQFHKDFFKLLDGNTPKDINTKKCNDCGNKLKLQWGFCPICGGEN